jgi:hypothetical protein
MLSGLCIRCDLLGLLGRVWGGDRRAAAGRFRLSALTGDDDVQVTDR